MEDLDSLLESISKKHFFTETLETRHSDSLDFYDVSVCGIKRALTEAFEAGQRTIEPIPVEEKPWNREGFCDENGCCWLFSEQCNQWVLIKRPTETYLQYNVELYGIRYTHCLPHYAIKVPVKEVPSMNIELTYFKPNGDYCSKGTLTLPADSPMDYIFDEVMSLRDYGELPGLSLNETDYNGYSVLIKHPNESPVLLNGVM